MSPLYLYAVLDAPPRGALGVGMTGEPLRIVRCADVVAAAGEMASAPALDPAALRGHDTVVRRLADAADAVLPARFGALAPTDAELCERLARAGGGLREALARVAGREQMILRVYGASADGRDVSSAPLAPEGSGAGTRYLAERARVHRAAAEVRELAPLRATLDRFVAAERVERHDTPPLVASVYHLLARGSAAAYTEAVQRAASELSGMRVTVSGPWAPYAFAPEVL